MDHKTQHWVQNSQMEQNVDCDAVSLKGVPQYSCKQANQFRGCSILIGKIEIKMSPQKAGEGIAHW